MARRKGSAPASSKCPACGTVHSRAVLEENLYVCPQCKHHLSMPSHARIATLVDEGTFIELDHSLVSVDPLEFADLRSYRARLQEARRETGVREAVTTGLCKIVGQRAVLVGFDFAFLGGTMGSVVGEKIAHAFEEAAEGFTQGRNAASSWTDRSCYQTRGFAVCNYLSDRPSRYTQIHGLSGGGFAAQREAPAAPCVAKGGFGEACRAAFGPLLHRTNGHAIFCTP